MHLPLKNEETLNWILKERHSLLLQDYEQVGMTDLVITLLVSLFFLLCTSVASLLSPSFPEAQKVRGSCRGSSEERFSVWGKVGDEA